MIKLFLLLLLLPSLAFGAQTFTIGEGSTTFDTSTGSQTINLSGVCPSGTYLFAWDGDYLGDTDKGCFTSGTLQKDGTVDLGAGGGLSASFGRTGVGFKITDENQYIQWAVTGGDGINIEDGTVWIDLYVFDNSPADSIVLFESYIDARNYLNLTYNSSGHLTGLYRGENTGKNVIGTVSLSVGWNTISYSWKRTGTDAHAVKVNDNAWEEEVESLSAWESAATSIVIGEKDTGGLWVDTLYIDNVYILTGYQTAHP